MGFPEIAAVLCSLSLCLGFGLSQFNSAEVALYLGYYVRLPGSIALSFVVIRVGLELDIRMWSFRDYIWDLLMSIVLYLFPFLLVSLYFYFVVSDTVLSLGND